MVYALKKQKLSDWIDPRICNQQKTPLHLRQRDYKQKHVKIYHNANTDLGGKKVRLVRSILHKDDFRTRYIPERREKNLHRKRNQYIKFVKILNVPVNNFCFMFLRSIN